MTRRFVFVLCVCLLVVVPAASAGAETSSSAQVVRVSEVNVLELDLGNGQGEPVRLIGLSSVPSDACGADQALSRVRALIEGQTVSVELQEAAQLGDPPSAYVWTPEGRNVAEVLIGEGEVLAAGTEQHRLNPQFAAAQTAAIRDHLGVWAPGTCRADSDSDPEVGAEGARLQAYLTSSSQALQQARLSAGILREQSRSAAQVGSTAPWQTTTRLALAWLQDASRQLDKPASGGAPANWLQSQVVQISHDLQRDADRFGLALDANDFADLQVIGLELGQTTETLTSMATQLDALAVAYGLGD